MIKANDQALGYFDNFKYLRATVDNSSSIILRKTAAISMSRLKLI